jgi:hypothetical protein
MDTYVHGFLQNDCEENRMQEEIHEVLKIMRDCGDPIMDDATEPRIIQFGELIVPVTDFIHGVGLSEHWSSAHDLVTACCQRRLITPTSGRNRGARYLYRPPHDSAKTFKVFLLCESCLHTRLLEELQRLQKTH